MAKGLSPLFATILLIFLSVALGSVVMSLSDFSEEGCVFDYSLIFSDDGFSILTNNTMDGVEFTFFDESFEQTLSVKSTESFSGLKEFTYPEYFKVKEMEVVPIISDETCKVQSKTFIV